jgi:hypothetical protein
MPDMKKVFDTDDFDPDHFSISRVHSSPARPPRSQSMRILSSPRSAPPPQPTPATAQTNMSIHRSTSLTPAVLPDAKTPAEVKTDAGFSFPFEHGLMKISALFSAKMFLAHTALQTRVGRKVIEHFIGGPGTSLLATFLDLSGLQLGKKLRDKMEENILKFAVKVKLLTEEKMIRQRGYWTLTDLLCDLAIRLYAGFVNSLERRKFVDVSPLIAAFNDIAGLLHSLLEPHSTAEEIKALRHLFGFFGGGSFLNSLYNTTGFIF